MIKSRRDAVASVPAGQAGGAGAEGGSGDRCYRRASCRTRSPRPAPAAAVSGAVAETGAAGPKDMGKVMAALKAKHGAALDMGKAVSQAVKAALA